MVLARSWIGVSFPSECLSEICKSRAVAARIEFPGCPPFVAVSAYLTSGVGMVQDALNILQAIGEAAASSSGPFLIGGDFNAGLEEAAEAGFAEKMCSDLLEASDGFGSCRGPTIFSNIDYFCCESNLARGVVSITTVMDVDPHPHRPVRMEVSTRDADYSYLAFEAMPATPRERIFGPLPQPPEWGGLLAAVAAFRAGLEDGTVQPSQALLDGADAAFATLAEAELQQATGSSCKVGCRAILPRLVRKSFRNQGVAKKLDPVGEARKLKWLKGRAPELEALPASRESGWRSKLAVLGAIVAKNPPSWLDGAGRAGEWHKWLRVCMHAVICIPESAEPALLAEFVLELARLASDCDRAVSHDNSTT